MCPPDFFGIEYEINPWMNRQRQADHGLAIEQWRRLHETLTGLGATVSLLEPVPGLPDLVFTANAALIYQDQAILSRFRHPQRQGEEAHNESWLAAHRFHIQRLTDAMYFEGAGDALFCGDNLFAGYRIRSDARALQQVGKLLDVRVFPLELVDTYYYHLDTCFCPLSPTLAIYYPGAFDDYGQRVLKQYVKHLIPVEQQEAESFACNAVVVGRHVVTNTGCPRLHHQLCQAGYTPIETPLSEFVKSGGSAKCLTLRLDGEEAAGWRQLADAGQQQ
ncbi:MAG: amidinotransferase [Planctomycetales bacterium]|nr:amidinotransferase [Planctomycetales bacterium]